MIFRVFGFAFAHFVLQLGVFAITFALGMGRFDTGESAGLFEKALGGVSDLLMLPLALPLVHWWPFGATGFPLEHLPFILNSLLWGVGLAYLWRWKRGTPDASPQPPAA
ncbi:hypothetical protein B1759_16570 [Rubrivirga sp. SAORIC476]|uniref:hypothetical protein n=1 Tax=Rubrivirga sp. SAORIC476 TaxID=1961794 RepID=UPI000BA9629E|nr:hypothetical protein [Rubrivirga sp. SAORIC476]PAP74792.1 hypothetical protein B1759_16570 [Rubrivirga sp. SAORIC476]